jgi:hypothetical protein
MITALHWRSICKGMANEDKGRKGGWQTPSAVQGVVVSYESPATSRSVPPAEEFGVPYAESTPCRRREREATYCNSMERSGLDGTLPYFQRLTGVDIGRLMDAQHEAAACRRWTGKLIEKLRLT